MRLYPIYFAWYTKQECAFSWRITGVIRAYHGRDTCVSWARYANCLRKFIYADTHLFLIIKRLCYSK